MLFLKWFTSRTARRAWQAAHHVEKILKHHRDLLSPDANAAVRLDLANVRATCRTGDKKAIGEALARLDKTANKHLKPYPHAAGRENIEVALVAIAVAMTIRTFFLCPFMIPTGSMQPTLYGVTHESLRSVDESQIPGWFKGFFEYWFNGVQYFHVVAKTDGELTYDPPTKVFFNLWQVYRINNVPQARIWFPPDDLFPLRAGLGQRTPVRAGQDIMKLRVISGDRLFADRISFNFRRPERGDIVVFETHGIREITEQLVLQSSGPTDTYYIKRLCGLGGERISLKPDCVVLHPRYGTALAGHLWVNETDEITAATPRFENLYSFPDVVVKRDPVTRTNLELPSVVGHENHYYGHALLERLAPGASHLIPPNHFFVMGDNTFNSSDSRYWGDFPQEKIIGKSFFVYWPIGGTTYQGEERPSRFGWAHR